MVCMLLNPKSATTSKDLQCQWIYPLEWKDQTLKSYNNKTVELECLVFPCKSTTSFPRNGNTIKFLKYITVRT